MKAKDYRRQIEEALAESEVEALATSRVPPKAQVKPALELLNDTTAPIPLRINALELLKAASFEINDFAPFVAEYISALQRIAAEEGGEPTLRREALEVLVAEHDEVARRILIEAVRSPDGAPVSPALALSLLARDDHGATLELAQAVLEESDAAQVRAQAVRILGTAPEAIDTLKSLLNDKDEAREVRQASAVALRALDVAEFEAEAVRVLGDTEDFSDIKATVEGALNRTRNAD